MRAPASSGRRIRREGKYTGAASQDSAATLGTIYWLSRRLGLERKISMLLAAGSAICGASAIMVLSPVVDAEKEDTSVSLLAITVMGLARVILYSLAQETLILSERTYALLCGSTLYQMRQVKAAASLLSHKALALAMPVKLLRISTLLPIAIIFSLLADGKGKKLFVPWFIVGSFAVAVAMVLFPPLAAYRAALAPIVGFLFSIAIAGIGLTMDLEAIIDKGAKPFLAVILGWVVMLALFLVVSGTVYYVLHAPVKSRAVATVAAIALFGTVFFGTLEHLRKVEARTAVASLSPVDMLLEELKHVDWRAGVYLAAVTTIAAPIGAYVVQFTGQQYVWYVYFVAVVYLTYRLFKPVKEARTKENLKLALMLAVPISILSGFLGVGPGFLLMPTLILLGYEPKKQLVSIHSR